GVRVLRIAFRGAAIEAMGEKVPDPHDKAHPVYRDSLRNLPRRVSPRPLRPHRLLAAGWECSRHFAGRRHAPPIAGLRFPKLRASRQPALEIGRASCRERGWMLGWW